MEEIIQKTIDSFTGIEIPDILLMAVSFVLLCVIFVFLKRNHGTVLIVLFSIVTVICAALIIVWKLDGKWILICPAVFLLVVCILFPMEIKRGLWNGERKSAKRQEVKISDKQVERAMGEIVRAVQNMAKQDVGALIILTPGDMPNAITESGTLVNSEISSPLIESIFFPNTKLHDGAMIIKGMKIVSAGCFLPLSQEIDLPQEIGTRHRAGIGITETVDVVSIIVSEESGVISVAQNGKLNRYVDTESLKKFILDYYKNLYKEKEKEKED